MTDELPKIYEPAQVEAQAYALWSKHNCFAADAAPPGAPAGEAYTIVIPPPNVTAALHLGHALNNTLQDILIRWRRMQGRNALWMPGTDHAGIATQTVVEKRILAEEGKRRTDLGREEFVGRVQAWKDQYEARIIEQLQIMGCSCDWRRTRFTMDEVCARAVRQTFFQLFRDGLIYRGLRLVNWDPATQTVLADDEVEHETVQGHFWYLRYPLAEPVEFEGSRLAWVTVATTRPETMLGDTAVAMNPRDPRATVLVGKTVLLPLVGRRIPIVADEHVVLPDPDSPEEKARFSTGFLKVTPAHDPDDWAIGQRHDLPVINVMAPDGTISDRHGWDDAAGSDAEQFLGMDRFEAREAIVEWFRQEDLLEQVRPYTHDVGHSYRSHVPIEPYLSDQWYIAVKTPIERLRATVGDGLIEGTDIPVNSLAGLALKPLLDGRLRFIPERYAKTYQNWLENLRDWPISRQLWWGHQIPVWHLTGAQETTEEQAKEFDTKIIEWRKQGRIETLVRQHDEYEDQAMEGGAPFHFICVRYPETEDRQIAEYLEAHGYQRDPDVLDTWFSSALWPFSTLGWPEPSKDLETFYPGSVLCTAREIITLWVSRMVMMGQYCAGDIPFADVFIHAMIQDGQGRKMSKSLGNGIDPAEVIDSHGADAMRFALAQMTTLTQDVRMPIEPMTLPDGRTVNSSPKFDLGRNFCNKLWNASRFALGNLQDMPAGAFAPETLHLADRWILSRLHRTIADVGGYLEAYQFSEPMQALYKFFWNDLCDWYLEIIKPRLRRGRDRPATQRVLAYVLDAVLRLMHPFIPFITEEIFQMLNRIGRRRDLDGLVELPAAETCMQAPWPAANPDRIDEDADREMAVVQTIIRLIREIRTRYQVPPKNALEVTCKTTEGLCNLLGSQRDLLCHLANLRNFRAGRDCAKPDDAAVAVADELELYVHGVVDARAERAKLIMQQENLAGRLQSARAKLQNENFLQRAKPQIVQREQERLAQLEEQLATVRKNLEAFGATDAADPPGTA